MRSEWKITTLGEIFNFSSGLSKGAEEFGFGHPFLSFKTVFNNYFVPETIKEMANTTDAEQEKCSVRAGDVFLTRTSETINELGMSCVALHDYPNAAFNGFTKRLRPKQANVIYPQYAAFYFRSSKFRHIVNSYATMTTRASLNNDILSRLPITLPSYTEQRVIGNVLFAIHEKIELNNKINANLEAQAQAIFKSWFVDFEPFQNGEFVDSELGRIPKGWEIAPIGELPITVTDYVANGSFASLKENVTLYNETEYAIFVRNTDLKSGSFNVYVDRHSYDFLSKSQLSGGEVIISNVGDVGSVYLCPPLGKPMTLGNNVIMLNSDGLNLFLYQLFCSREGQHLLDSITGGSAQPKFNKTDFRSLKIVVPDNIAMNSFNVVIGKLQDYINNISQQSRTLAALRDTLLPKLMSGEIEVSIEGSLVI